MDRRHDNRLTVIQATPTKCGRYTRIEAWATDADTARPMRFRLTIHGLHDIDFGWLIAPENATHWRIFSHEDAPGYLVRIRGKVAHLKALA